MNPTPVQRRAIRVIVVDDDAIVRNALAAYVTASASMAVVGAFENGAQAVDAVTEMPVDVVLMDVRMPVMGGIEATTRIREVSPKTRVLLLTSFDEGASLEAGLKAGASGFLLKDTTPRALSDAVHAVMQGTTVVSPGPMERLLNGKPAARPQADGAPEVDLSARELEILTLLSQAMSNGEIADELHLSESTVKSHVSAIMSKLGVSSRLKAVVKAYEWGLVDRT